MTLDPGAAEVLRLGAEAGNTPPEEGTAAEARATDDAFYAGLHGEREAVAETKEIEVAGPRGPIRLRIHRGTDAPDANAPAVLYLHGGGWVLGGLDSHDEICRWFANLGRAVVVCPAYRLAPEHRFPAGLDDCAATLRFIAAEADALGIDAKRIAVAGDSAGGNLSAVLALMARDGDVPALAAQLLIYPNTDAAQTADSYARFAEGYGLTSRTMRWFRDQYLSDDAEMADWRVSPLRAASLAGAPPAYVVLAGYDILVDEGEAYAERLKADGVPVALVRRPDQIHGFASAGRFIPAARETIAQAVEAWARFEKG